LDSLWDLILDKRLKPDEGLAGEGGGLVMTDMTWATRMRLSVVAQNIEATDWAHSR